METFLIQALVGRVECKCLPELQHALMIEAVENHMPEVIVIDEIGTQEDARVPAQSLSVAYNW